MYHLEVDTEAEIKVGDYGYNDSDKRIDLCIKSNYLSIQEHWNLVTAHRPKGNAPILEGVPLITSPIADYAEMSIKLFDYVL